MLGKTIKQEHIRTGVAMCQYKEKQSSFLRIYTIPYFSYCVKVA